MKKIINPWRDMEAYHCFGCAPNNKFGLRMEFYEEGDEVVSTWKPRPEFQGWVNSLHGGIQATLADEISSWVVFRKYQTSGVTTKLEMRYMKPMHTTDDHITLRARVVKEVRNLVSIAVELYNEDDVLCSKGECVYYLFPKERAREEFHFFDCPLEGEQ